MVLQVKYQLQRQKERSTTMKKANLNGRPSQVARKRIKAIWKTFLFKKYLRAGRAYGPIRRMVMSKRQRRLKSERDLLCKIWIGIISEP
jgi:hypothetical protein